MGLTSSAPIPSVVWTTTTLGGEVRKDDRDGLVVYGPVRDEVQGFPVRGDVGGGPDQGSGLPEKDAKDRLRKRGV